MKKCGHTVPLHGTTILCLRHKGEVVIAGDGQITMGDTIVKHGAKKIRRMANNEVLAGFAGSTADAITLFERFEEKLGESGKKLKRAAVEMAKEWRMDKVLRRLEALMVVADRETSLLISGGGDVIEPDDHVIGVGSGGVYALAAAKALMRHSDLDAARIAREAIQIASEICVYSNQAVEIETLTER